MDRKCDSAVGISQSKHTRRIEAMTLSRIVFAFGRCGGHGDHEIAGDDSVAVQAQKGSTTASRL